MEKENKTKEKGIILKSEAEEIKDRLLAMFRIERIFEIIGIIIGLIMIKNFNINLKIDTIILIFFLFILTLPAEYFFKKKKEEKEIINTCFIYWFFNITIISAIGYTIGGIWWVGFFLVIFPLIHANFLLPQRKGIILTIYIAVLVTFIVVLEDSKIISHEGFFYVDPNLYENHMYIALTLLMTTIVIFPYIAYLTSSSSEDLRKRTKELIKTYEELEEIKNTLEIKVKARTRELEEFTKSLEQKVEERTKELQKRLEDLERFRKITIGRELRMIELKKEIKQLKEELKKQE